MDTLISPNGVYSARLQDDGNFVVYKNGTQPIFYTGGDTTCTPVVYDSSRANDAAYNAQWQSLINEGWFGKANDGMEALYPPYCPR
jgi:hypothetical protein